MSVHETSLFFRGKSDRRVMIAPVKGAEGAIGAVVYGSQGKDGTGNDEAMLLWWGKGGDDSQG